MIDRNAIREGMTVFSSDGEKLGKVASCDEAGFIIEKGFLFPKDYLARYDEVANLTDDDVRLASTKEQFRRMYDEETEARAEARRGTGPRPSATARAGEEVTVPVAEEELDVVKRDREKGDVRLRKDVVTERKHVDVPVTREEVRVERVPATEGSVSPGERPFEEKTVSMPVHEEEVEVRKRPVVKEEVRLHKERTTEQRAADADVRREEVRIEGEQGAARRDDEDVP